MGPWVLTWNAKLVKLKEWTPSMYKHTKFYKMAQTFCENKPPTELTEHALIKTIL